MERKDIKRGSEMINLESEEESAAKQPKLSEIGKVKTDEDDFEDLTSECPERPENVIEDPPLPVSGEGSEMMNLESEEETSEKQPKPRVSGEGSEMMNLESEEETSEKQPKPRGEDHGFVLVYPPISDNWKYVKWQKCASSLWVVTKSPYLCDWIKDVLKSEIFNEYKSDETVETFPIVGDWKFRKSVSSCSCVMFCFESDGRNSESLREVKKLSTSYGLKNVIVLLSENTPDNWPPGQMNDQHKLPVLNFSKHQITWYKDNLKFYCTKIEKMKRILKGSSSWTGHKVGIFSRSSESEYEWLKRELESEYFRGAVENVQPYYISNRGFQQFMTNVSNSTFGILYHTKNRGRINITNVTDSLYDEELDYMSQMMNRQVIVVVDDLNIGDDEEKSRILCSQPSIEEKALDLFLITTEEKKLLEPLVKMRNYINGETMK
ncbi:uncharacterized protein [Phyllobates terribilis]|uniref:uncharacterized protein isoform X3 n=1 Tax=Phyllobates terribilis TaxID=111132 RepID=UPI003CCAFD0B